MQLSPAFPPLSTMVEYLVRQGRSQTTAAHYCRLVARLCAQLPHPEAVADPQAVATALEAYGAASEATRAQSRAAWHAYARSHPGKVALPHNTTFLPLAAASLLRKLRDERLTWMQIAGLTWGHVGPGARYLEIRLPGGRPSLKVDADEVRPLADALGGEVMPTWQLFCGPAGAPRAAVDLRRAAGVSTP